MKIEQIHIGKIHILSQEEIFEKQIKILKKTFKEKESPITVGLTGGSTPKAFYKWAVENNAFKGNLLENIYWMTSDERHVSIDSEESNFGNADRLMLTPLNVEAKNKIPWKTNLSPEETAKDFNHIWEEQLSENSPCFDVCFLGMGDDCHIASLFPESPLITSSTTNNFDAVEVPGKGWRLSITPTGLEHCKKIVLTVLGKNKADALLKVFNAPTNPIEIPAQLLKAYYEKVTWLLDKDAASKLKLEQ